MKRETIFTSNAPTPGFYSQAVAIRLKTYTRVILAGQTGNIPDGKDEPVIEGGVGPQTTQILKNISAILQAAGGSMVDLVRVRVYLRDDTHGMPAARKESREAFAKAYEEFFAQYEMSRENRNLPARAMVWVSEVPLEFPAENTLVEIEVEAVISNP
ncbi:MAG: RidA family protein [Candidatus Paceibacterota bacterium]